MFQSKRSTDTASRPISASRVVGFSPAASLAAPGREPAAAASTLAPSLEPINSSTQPMNSRKSRGSGRNMDADERAGHHPRNGAGRDHPGQGPQHPAFAEVAVNPGGDGHHVEEMVGGRHRRPGQAEHAHLEGQEQKGSRQPAHRHHRRHAERHVGAGASRGGRPARCAGDPSRRWGRRAASARAAKALERVFAAQDGGKQGEVGGGAGVERARRTAVGVAHGPCEPVERAIGGGRIVDHRQGVEVAMVGRRGHGSILRKIRDALR